VSSFHDTKLKKTIFFCNLNKLAKNVKISVTLAKYLMRCFITSVYDTEHKVGNFVTSRANVASGTRYRRHNHNTQKQNLLKKHVFKPLDRELQRKYFQRNIEFVGRIL